MRCSVDGCESVSEVRGLCGRHYGRAKRHGDIPIASGWHRLEGIDPSSKTAECSNCGRVGIVLKRGASGPRYRCRIKVREEKQRSPKQAARFAAFKATAKENPETVKVARRRARLRKYGLDESSFLELVKRQGSRCALCGDEEPLVVDHDHVTGSTRELLCSTCNSALGLANEDPVLLRKMAAYIELHRKAA